jgi:hypothetical protein
VFTLKGGVELTLALVKFSFKGAATTSSFIVDRPSSDLKCLKIDIFAIDHSTFERIDDFDAKLLV